MTKMKIKEKADGIDSLSVSFRVLRASSVHRKEGLILDVEVFFIFTENFNESLYLLVLRKLCPS